MPRLSRRKRPRDPDPLVMPFNEHVLPSGDNTVALGSPTQGYAALYLDETSAGINFGFGTADECKIVPSAGGLIFTGDDYQFNGHMELRHATDALQVEFTRGTVADGDTIANLLFSSDAFASYAQIDIVADDTGGSEDASVIVKTRVAGSLVESLPIRGAHAGTWTPAITFATPGDLAVTYTLQSGVWTRTGRLITAQFALLTSSFTHTTAAGDLRMTGLFHTAATAGNNAISFQGITKAGYTSVSATIAAGAVLATFPASGSGVAISNVTAANMPTGGSVLLSGTLTYNV